MNPYGREDLWWVRRLVGFATDFVRSDFLALLAKYVDDIECCTTGKCYGHKFNGLRTRCTGSVVENDVMSGAACGYELATGSFRLCKSNSAENHDL